MSNCMARVGLALSLLLLAAAVPAAALPTCSGLGCDGQDPVATGCDADAHWVLAKPLSLGGFQGYVQYMYSDACEAAFVRLSTSADPGTSKRVYFLRSSGGAAINPIGGASYFKSDYSLVQVVNTDYTYHLNNRMLSRYSSRASSSLYACADFWSPSSVTYCTVLPILMSDL